MSITWHGVTLKFEFGWASNPSVAIGSTTWTDDSTYVRTVYPVRGRNSENDSFNAGRCSIVLDNRTRRFDPNYAAGALFGNLVPMRRFRFTVTYNAITYAVWHGFVDDLPQAYDPPNDATVMVNCTDGFKVASLLTLPESVYAVQIPLDTPAAWWRLGEQSGTQVIDSSGNGQHGYYVGGATFNSRTGLIVGGTDSAIGFDGVDDAAALPGVLTAFPVTVEGWMSWTSGGTARVAMFEQASFNGQTRVSVFGGTDGSVEAELNHGSGASKHLTVTTTALTFGDGNPHHVAVVFTDGSTITIYVDGVAPAVGTVSAGAPIDFPGAGIARIGAAIVDATVSYYGPSTVDEVAVYSSALSAGTIAAHYGYGATPWEGDTSGARIGRLLDLAAWPSADRDIDTGISTMQALTLASANLLPTMQKVEASEQGQLFMGADGKVVFRDRHARFEDATSITSQATFGDTAGELDYSDIVTDGGEQSIFNRIRASRTGGATIDVSDVTSIAKFYERTDEITGLENESDLEVIDLANWRLATHKNPIQRVTVLEVRPRSDPVNLFPIVLGLDIGERITVKRRPQGVGAVLTYTVLVEGVEHTITPDGAWTTRFYLSSLDSQATVQPLIWDDATYGKWDTAVWGY